MSSGTCPCEGGEDPLVVSNPPGQSTIAYRVDDFGGFRRALLAPLPNETALLGWRPTTGDLGLQLLEWWAYLADVLTFYNERIANESYLRTAELAPSVAGLVALLGYQPRPAIAATGQLAAIHSNARPDEPVVIPAGMQIASTATPGVPAETFEADAATFIGPSVVPVVLEPNSLLFDPPTKSVLLRGTVASLKPDDELLLVERASAAGANPPNFAPVTVVSTTPEPDPNGGPNTRVVLNLAWGTPDWLAAARAQDYRLVRTTQSASLWTQTTQVALSGGVLSHLDVMLSAAVRGIATGDLAFVDGGRSGALGVVSSATEEFGMVPYPIPTGASPPNPPDIPIAHTVLSVEVAPGSFPDEPSVITNPSGAAPDGLFTKGGTWFWMVSAYTPLGWSVPSAEIPAQVPPGGIAHLKWDSVDGAIGYRLYRASFSGGEYTSPALVATFSASDPPNYIDIGAAPGEGSIPSPSSIVVRYGLADVGAPIPTPAPTLSLLPAEVNPPAGFIETLMVPAGLTATPRSTGGSFPPGTQYWTVTALGDSGQTAGSEQASGDFAGPEATGSATLNWNAVPAATGYNVYRSTSSGGQTTSPALVATIASGLTTTYTDSGTAPAAGAAPATSSATAGPGAGVFASGSVAALVEDGSGAGIPIAATANGDGTLALAPTDTTPTTFSLTAPVQLLVDLVEVSRGTTVAAETLGTGNASVASQTFTLAKSPLTYLASGAEYVSALQIAVDAIVWAQADTFYEQPADATVYVVAQLPNGASQVRFGDGVNGARLPTGSTVLATYRYGAGAASPPAGRLTTVLRPQPNLASVHNPVAPTGGADPQSPEDVRENAPASVLTFGRAISADDYETVAAQAPGVTRARAYWIWDPEQQRTLVTIYVGDDVGAKTAAIDALAGAEDPNRPVSVVQATPIPLTIACTVAIVTNRVSANVIEAAADALTELFEPANMAIGQPLYVSQIEAALLVDGASAIHSLIVTAGDADLFAIDTDAVASANPGQGSFYTLGAVPQLNPETSNG